MIASRPDPREVAPECVSFLRSVLRPDKPLSLPSNTEAMATLCLTLRIQNIASFIHGILTAQGRSGALPDRARFFLRVTALQQQAHTRMLLQRCRHLAQLLDPVAAVVFLKGPLMGWRYYGQVEWRTAHDIDILVQPSDLTRVQAAVEADGWREQKVPYQSHEIKYRDDTLALDVHRTVRLDPHFKLDVQGMWERRERLADFPTEDGAASTTGGWVLCPEDDLVFLLVSLFYDIVDDKAYLRQIIDIHYILERLDKTTRWDDFFARRQLEGLRRIAPTVLQLVLTLLRTETQFPQLSQALARQQDAVRNHTEPEALDLFRRPHKHPPLASRQGVSRLLWRMRMFAWAAPLYEPQESVGMYVVKKVASHVNWAWQMRGIARDD